MRNLLTKLPLFLLTGFLSTAQAGFIYYEDSFTGDTGIPLVTRQPDVANTNTTTYSGSEQNGSKLLVLMGGVGVSISGNGTVSLPMPKFNKGDIITLSMDATPKSGGNPFGYIALGFTEGNGDTLSDQGILWASLMANGFGNVWLGSASDGTGSQLYTGDYNIGNGEDATRITMTFDTGKKNLSVTIGSATVYDGPVTCGLDSLQYVTVQFIALNSSNSGAPAFIDNLRVEVDQKQP